MRSLEIHVKVHKGSNIHGVCEELVELAKFAVCSIQTEFNGTPLTATPTSIPQEMVKRYFAAKEVS